MPSDLNSEANPLVSILINNYNYARFLTRAIQSALDQTYQNIEIVVVDDGSTDNSRSVIESFGGAVKPIFKENAGQGSSYNAGFEASRGQLIHFLDADDYLECTAIEEVVSRWRPGTSKAHFFLKVVSTCDATSTSAVVPSGKLPSGDLLPQVLSSGCYVSPPATGNVYSRDCLRNILPMPPSDWITAADLYCIFGSAFLGEVVAINLPLGAYRIHGSNIDAQLQVSGELLRYRLKKEMRRDALLVQLARKHNRPYVLGTVSHHTMHLKLRFSSFVLDRSKHPFPEDKLVPLFIRTIQKCWNDTSFPLLKRLMFTAWLISLLLTKSSQKNRILTLGFAPISRPAVVQRLLSSLVVKA